MNQMIEKYRDVTLYPQGDWNKSIKKDMIYQSAPLVNYFVEKLAARLPPHISKEELKSAGIIGLMDAIEKYDPTKDIKFQTYAKFRIRGAILDELRKMDWVPRSARKEIKKIEDATIAIRAKKGREPNDNEIAEELNMELETYFKILKKVSGVNLLSLDEVKPGENVPLVNKIATDSPTQLEELQKKELKNHVKKMISELSQKEQMVISLYYYEELTLKEIAEIMKLTESRISQIHSKVIISLRSKLRKNYEN